MVIFDLFSKEFGRAAGSIIHLGWSFLEKLVNGSKPLTIFTDGSVLDVRLVLAALFCLKTSKKLKTDCQSRLQYN